MNWQAVHLNLLRTLPVRTIPARQPKAEPTRSVYAGRPLEINGKRYDSMHEAARACKVSRDTIYRWIRDGKATYIESDTGEEE